MNPIWIMAGAKEVLIETHIRDSGDGRIRYGVVYNIYVIPHGYTFGLGSRGYEKRWMYNYTEML